MSPDHASSASTSSDVELFSKLRDGHTAALEALAVRYAQQMGAVAFAILSRRDLVQDVVQDVLYALWEQRATLTIRDNITGYLYRMVRNRATDLLRHEQTESRISAVAGEHDYARVSTNDAERTLEEHDTRTHLERALEHIPPGPRRVFLLSYEHGLSYAEIAEALGLTPGSVRTLMYRATQRLAAVFPRRLV